MSEHYGRFFELSLDLLCVAGADGFFKLLNPAWERTLGWTTSELLARPYLDFVHPDDRGKTARAAEAQAQKQDIVDFLNRYRRKDGTYRWFRWKATQVQPNGLMYAIARDVTDLEAERTKLQAQFLQAQKMEAVGRLAAGVAHDFNNVLTAVGGYCHFLLGELRPDDERRKEIEGIQQATGRAATLTRQLLAFSRNQVLQPRVIDLNAVVKELGPILRRAVSEEIELATNLDPAVGPVRADPGQVQQILLNLVFNSRDAIAKRGRITVETANVDLDAEYVKAHPGSFPGPQVMLSVSDTGAGMARETIARLFEPFFTTKDAGVGTGLGLCTVYGIVKQSGGSIYVDSEPGRGATFKIYFPRAQATEERPAPSVPTPPPRRGSELILVVEDDELVRRVLIRFLEGAGYGVLSARDPDEALELWSARKSDIALLLTDLVMPRMRGDDLAQRLCAESPALRVIFTSGYTEAGIVRHELLGPKVLFLQKPLNLALLADKIRGLLDLVGSAGA
ncbi:MAG: PAS domain S-box protein [Elusimicrobia bacterium]|nr:PAS domain S-box protein [Elusimicrobiota bacterium]